MSLNDFWNIMVLIISNHISERTSIDCIIDGYLFPTRETAKGKGPRSQNWKQVHLLIRRRTFFLKKKKKKKKEKNTKLKIKIHSPKSCHCPINTRLFERLKEIAPLCLGLLAVQGCLSFSFPHRKTSRNADISVLLLGRCAVPLQSAGLLVQSRV
jgi:hypothetical protein